MFCLQNFTSEDDLDNLIQNLDIGDVLMFVGEVAFDEPHDLTGWTQKFALITGCHI